jgi:hypothetical protein
VEKQAIKERREEGRDQRLGGQGQDKRTTDEESRLLYELDLRMFFTGLFLGFVFVSATDLLPDLHAGLPTVLTVVYCDGTSILFLRIW